MRLLSVYHKNLPHKIVAKLWRNEIWISLYLYFSMLTLVFPRRVVFLSRMA